MKKILAGMCAVALLHVGCGGETATKDAPSSDNSAASSAKPAASAAPSASQDAGAVEKKEEEKGPIKWADFPGPEVDPPSAKKVWTVLPVSDSFTSLKFKVADVKESKDKAVLVSAFKETWVPGAFAIEAKDQTLQKGDAVLAGVYATGVHGRVVEVGDKVKVKLKWIDKAAEEEVALDEVLKLTGTELAFGEPVAYKDDKGWHDAVFIHNGGDKSWVLGWGGKAQQVNTADVKNIDINKAYKAGDEVWAPFVGTFKPAKIVEVMDDGSRIKIDMDGKESVVSYIEVTSPIE